MATHTPVTAARTANAITMTAAEATDKWANGGKDLLIVEHTNGAGSSVTLTITTTIAVDDEAVADKTISIGPGELHILGPFPINYYNDGNGEVNLAWSDETDITLAVLRTN